MSEIDPASETTKKQQKLFNPRTFCTTDATQNQRRRRREQREELERDVRFSHAAIRAEFPDGSVDCADGEDFESGIDGGVFNEQTTR